MLDDGEGKGPITDPLKAASVRELEGWIDQDVRFDVKATAPMTSPWSTGIRKYSGKASVTDVAEASTNAADSGEIT